MPDAPREPTAGRGDAAVGLLLAALAAALLGLALTGETRSPFSSLGSMFWPKLVLGALLVAALLLPLQAWRRPSGGSAPPIPGRLVRPLAMAGLVLLYVGAVELVGFPWASALFAAAAFALLGGAGWRAAALYALGLLAAFWLVFIWLLEVSVPRGLAPFRDLNVWLF